MAQQSALTKRKVVGDLEAVSLFDVCQVLMIARKTGSLRLESNGRRATVTFIDGQIVGAVDEMLKEGEAALQRLMTWRVGTFEFAAGPAAAGAPARITTPTDALLLEAARRLDETKETLEESGIASEPGAHEAALQEKQRFQKELSDLFSSLENESAGEIDFRKEVPLETLLATAMRRGATTLHLRVGETLKARGARGLFQIGNSPITRRAIDRIASTFVGGGEKLVLLEMRDRVVKEKLVEGIGYVRLEVLQDDDLRRVVLTLLEPDPLPLDAFGVPRERVAPMLGAPRGLMLIASPPRGGKSMLAASIAAAVGSGRGRHVVIFEEARRYRLREERGVLEQCDLSYVDTTRDAMLEQVWRRKADLLVIDAARRPAQVEAALEAAATGALVIAAVEAAGCIDAVVRFLAIADEASRPARAAQLADTLLGVVTVRPVPGEAAAPRAVQADPRSTSESGDSAEPRATQAAPRWHCEILPRLPGVPAAIRAGDGEALARCLADPAVLRFPA
jgi:Tfp pilus assembly pilus retraction ATPase PilT